jgi:hypothetical protein
MTLCSLPNLSVLIATQLSFKWLQPCNVFFQVSRLQPAASGRLLTVVGTLIGTAVLGFILSNWLHNRTRLRILRSLVFTAGRDARDSLWFKELQVRTLPF